MTTTDAPVGHGQSPDAPSEQNQALPRWDLDRLDPGDGLELILDAIVDRCAGIRERWAGRVAASPPDQLALLLAEVGEVRVALQRPAAYLNLRFADGTAQERDLDLEAALTRAVALAERALDFFTDEWQRLPAGRSEELRRSPALVPYREHLAELRRAAGHLLPTGQEDVLSARDDAVQSWVELYDDELAAATAEIDGEALGVEEIIALLGADDPARRRQAHEALGEALAPRAPLVARCLDALVADRLAVDRLRGLGSARRESDLDNGVDSGLVDAMLDTVDAASGLGREWWRTKARLLGLDRLHVADLRAPVGDELRVPYPYALRTVVDALRAYAPMLAGPVESMLAAGTIDAESRADKAGNAFCLLPGPDDPPYVSLHYGGGPRDLLRLAHELGHAVHYALSARRQPSLVYEAGIIVSELAAFLVEGIVVRHAEQVWDAGDLPGLRVARADTVIDAIFRQSVITRWESRIYTVRGSDSRLTADRLGDLWLAEYTRLLGDAVTVAESYRNDWMRIAHLFHGRFYNYSYIFAQLCALIAEHRLATGDADPAGLLVDFLSQGGSAPLADQLALLGLWPERAGFWQEGLGRLRLLLPHAGIPAVMGESS